MNLATKFPDASSEPTKPYKRVTGAPEVTSATSASNCVVFRFDDHTRSGETTPASHKPIGELLNRWSKDTDRRAAIERARSWVADTFHSEDGVTVRTLRLKKGWSQTQLAKELGTSQSHVARIERGTENIAIDTCRRLCVALGIDMNTLDGALRQQENIAQASH